MVKCICPNCGFTQFRDPNNNCVSNAKSLDVHGTYVCAHCGTEISREHLNQLITDAAQDLGTTLKLYTQARTAKKGNDHGTAADLYQQILDREPDSWEAAFYSVCCGSWSSGEIESACDAVKACLENVFDLIDTLPQAKKKDTVKLVVADACHLALQKYDAATQQHMALAPSAMKSHEKALKNQLISAMNIAITCSSLVIERYGEDAAIAPVAELSATCAVQMQTRQPYIPILMEPETLRTCLEWIGKYNPEFVANYKKKQNKSMATGTIVLMVLGAIFLALGLLLDGTFAKWFCIPMAVFCFGYGLFRIIIQAANKKLGG